MRAIITRIAGVLFSTAGALGILWAQVEGIFTPENAYYLLTALIVCVVIGIGLFIWSFFLPRNGKHNKRQDKILLDKAYTKVLELLPKMKTRLADIPYEVNKKQIKKSTFLSLNQYVQKTNAGTTMEERFTYFAYLTRWMDNHNIKLIDCINNDTEWKRLEGEMNQYNMPISDKKLKRDIWIYIRFIIGMYYERVYDEYESLFFGVHGGKQNRDAVNELILNEISTRLARRIEKLRSRNN